MCPVCCGPARSLAPPPVAGSGSDGVHAACSEILKRYEDAWIIESAFGCWEYLPFPAALKLLMGVGQQPAHPVHPTRASCLTRHPSHRLPSQTFTPSSEKAYYTHITLAIPSTAPTNLERTDSIPLSSSLFTQPSLPSPRCIAEKHDALRRPTIGGRREGHGPLCQQPGRLRETRVLFPAASHH